MPAFNKMPKTIVQKSRNIREAECFLKENFSSPTHWPDWNLIVSKHYGSDFYYYFAREGDELIGICPVHEEKNGILRNLYSGQYHYIPYGGWIFKKNFEFSKFPLHCNQALTVFNLPVNSNPRFKSGYKEFNTLIIDLQKSEEEIWEKCIHSKRRNMIRKAEKKGVKIKIEECHSNEEFYSFYSDFNRRNGLTELPFEIFSRLNNTENINVLYLFAIYQKKTLAITVINYDKDYAIYWLGINGKDVPNNGQGEMLQWEAIKYVKSKGCKYYDLCYIEKTNLPRIYEFKKGFSNLEVKVPLIVQKSLTYKVISRIKRCF